jgi:glycosyltransferase involved in cell wall biosynthesis
MSKFLIGLFFIGAAFSGSLYFGKMQALRKEPTVSFKPTEYPAITRPFVIVVVGYNNGAYLEKTLESIYSQNYSNYRLVYVDDASSDGSFDLAKDLLYDTNKKVTFIQNEHRLGVLSNLSRVVSESLDDEIIAVVGGEDWLAHEWVLSRLNQYYANPDLWITYGQSCEFPSYAMNDRFTPARDKPFEKIRLNTFYAGLFKEIGLDGFFDGESIISASVDMAYLIPMLEMAEGHSTFIPEVFYVSNSLSSSVENPEVIVRCETKIREMAAYEPLSRWGVDE